MVMRNRHEGSGTPHWWDDLPPGVRSRFSRPPTEADADELDDCAGSLPDPRPAPTRGQFLIDMSQIAMMLFLIAIVILLYLLVALSYVQGWQPAR